MKLYHLTPKALLDEVLRSGLDPSFSASSLPAMFLAGSAMTARNYEGMKSGPCALIEIDLPPSLQDSLVADNYELRDLLGNMSDEDLARHGLPPGAQAKDCSWQQSLAICDQVACLARIAPAYLTPVRPAFEPPTQSEIVSILRKHPLIRLNEEVNKAFLVGSFAKEALGLGKTHANSDVDILLAVAPSPGESESAMESRYRQKLMAHFMANDIRGRQDSVHPQWCGRRVDLYFTYDASCNPLPLIELKGREPKSSASKTTRPR